MSDNHKAILLKEIDLKNINMLSNESAGFLIKSIIDWRLEGKLCTDENFTFIFHALKNSIETYDNAYNARIEKTKKYFENKAKNDNRVKENK